MNTTSFLMRGDLFFKYPEPGNAGAKWRPSWNQVLTMSLSEYDTRRDSYTGIWKDTEADVDHFQGFCVENGIVRGLAVLGLARNT